VESNTIIYNIRRMAEYISCKTILPEQNTFPKSSKVWLSCRSVKRLLVKTISPKREKSVLDCSVSVKLL